MHRLKLLVLAAILLMTTHPAQGSVKFNQSRSITISGVIESQTLAQANQLLAFAETSKAPIDILIASPGGAVSYGLFFIEAMKVAQSKGVVIRCFVPHLAASMAFTIFTQCTEKFALPYAQLLFHSPRIQGRFLITPEIAVRLATGLRQLEDTLFELILPAMGVTKDNGLQWFTESYLDERMFLGKDLLEESPTPWFQVVDKIEGATNLYPDAWGPERGAAGKQDRANYVYIFRNN